jgi:subtilisin-like proprotein convertase family protein
VSDVNLGLNISHATRGQLKVTLQAPGDATATTIVNTSSDSYDNYDVLIDDASGNAINDGSNDTVASPYYDRTAGPSTNGSLDSFNRVRSLGTWTVFICDNTNNTTGSVNLVRLDLTGTPTAVELKSFTATGSRKATILSWETTSELDNLGFNLYRATSMDGVRTRLNAKLIPTLVYPGSPFGAVYSYTDTSPKPKLPYYYWLENLDIHGNTELHGPIQLKTK